MVKFLNGSDLDDMQFIILENERLLARVKQLESGSGGIMEMKQTIADKEKEIERLQRDLLLVVEYDSNLLNNLRMRRYGS